MASRPARRDKLDRATLEARITTARNDPRFFAPAAILFRNRETKEATDEELLQLLDTLEALAEIVDSSK
jgi:lysyl-tRNA synthetase class I